MSIEQQLFSFSYFEDSSIIGMLMNSISEDEHLYNYENMTIAESYLLELIQSNENRNQEIRINRVQKELVKIVVKLWINDGFGNLPTLDEILDYIMNTRCDCTLEFNEELIKQMYLFYIINHGKIPTCQMIEISYEFYNLHQRYPFIDEINQVIRRMIQFTASPSDFHSQDKVEIGVSNLENIKYCEMKQNQISLDTGCSLCQEDIKDGQKYVKLSPCGHIFHYDEKECLDEASIITWLRKNKKCPNCKTEVEINN